MVMVDMFAVTAEGWARIVPRLDIIHRTCPAHDYYAELKRFSQVVMLFRTHESIFIVS